MYSDIRGWSPGLSGLAFCGMGVGSVIVIACEPLFRKMINAHAKDPETGSVPAEAMVSAVCIASILMPVGEIWFAWTGTPNVHWIVSILAGIPFGAGNTCLFIYSNNYLVHSYGMYAASALAGNTFLRSIAGATLPLAGPAMYASLGPHWAGTLLGLLEAVFVPIPFVFYKYGHRIRKKSRLIRAMREDKERADSKKKKALDRLNKDSEKRGETEAAAGAGMFTGQGVTEEYELERAMSRMS